MKTLKLTPCPADEKHEACRHEEAESSDVLRHMQKRVNLFEEPSGQSPESGDWRLSAIGSKCSQQCSLGRTDVDFWLNLQL